MRFKSIKFRMCKTEIIKILRSIEEKLNEDAIEHVGPRGFYIITIEGLDE